MFKTSGRASFLIIRFQFLQYYGFVVLFGDAFAPFHQHFSCDSSIAYKTFFALKDRFAINGHLLCLVVQILLLKIWTQVLSPVKTLAICFLS